MIEDFTKCACTCDCLLWLRYQIVDVLHHYYEQQSYMLLYPMSVRAFTTVHLFVVLFSCFCEKTEGKSFSF